MPYSASQLQDGDPCPECGNALCAAGYNSTGDARSTSSRQAPMSSLSLHIMAHSKREQYYGSQQEGTIAQQLQKAGLRLAYILNDEFR